MAKYFGAVGFVHTKETGPGVWIEDITERYYYGDITRNTKQYRAGEYLNDNLNISNDISIIADPYASQNFHSIRYISYMGSKWKVNNVEVMYPRLILHIGGVYNGEQTETA